MSHVIDHRMLLVLSRQLLSDHLVDVACFLSAFSRFHLHRLSLSMTKLIVTLLDIAVDLISQTLLLRLALSLAVKLSRAHAATTG